MTADLSPLRAGRVTGSRVGAILGLKDAYQSRDGVLREMVRQAFGAPREFTGNWLTEQGKDREEQVRAWYEATTGRLVLAAQEFVVHPNIPWLGVSPDGIADDVAVEIKAQTRMAKWSKLSDKPSYGAQVQLTLACTGLTSCDFVVAPFDGEPTIERVESDPEWLPSVLPELEAFHDEYQRIIADPDLAAPFLADKERRDDAWRLAAIDYHIAADAEAAAARKLDEAKERLRELASGGNAAGCGVSVSVAERAGSVDWKKLAAKHLPDVDVEPFRKPAQTIVAVRDTRGTPDGD